MPFSGPARHGGEQRLPADNDADSMEKGCKG